MSQAENKNKEKTDWSVHVICLWAQQLNIHLNNQMMTCLAVQTLTNQTQSEGTLGEWTQGGRTDQTKPQKTKSKQKQKTKGKKYIHMFPLHLFSSSVIEKYSPVSYVQRNERSYRVYKQQRWRRTKTWRLKHTVRKRSRRREEGPTPGVHRQYGYCSHSAPHRLQSSVQDLVVNFLHFSTSSILKSNSCTHQMSNYPQVILSWDKKYSIFFIYLCQQFLYLCKYQTRTKHFFKFILST